MPSDFYSKMLLILIPPHHSWGPQGSKRDYTIQQQSLLGCLHYDSISVHQNFSAILGLAIFPTASIILSFYSISLSLSTVAFPKAICLAISDTFVAALSAWCGYTDNFLILAMIPGIWVWVGLATPWYWSQQHQWICTHTDLTITNLCHHLIHANFARLLCLLWCLYELDESVSRCNRWYARGEWQCYLLIPQQSCNRRYYIQQCQISPAHWHVGCRKPPDWRRCTRTLTSRHGEQSHWIF